MSDLLRDKRMRSETQISEQLDERVAINVYPKNSFDRFGDDLTEEILQYLTLEDKVRLECVSKQWRRLVFNKQFVIEIHCSYITTKDNLNQLIIDEDLDEVLTEKKLNNEGLISVLKKCPNITDVKIKIRVNGEVLSLIGQYCNRIKSLTHSTQFDNALDFFRIYGHKLEKLDIIDVKQDLNENSSEDIKPILEFCPNLKKIEFFELSVLFTEDKKFLPKLEHIISGFAIDSEHIDEMKILSDKYSQSIKILNVYIDDMNAKELKTCIEYIARFENLKELKLEFRFLETTEPIDNCLSLIGQKCSKLLKLDFSIDEDVQISDRFFDVFKEFKAIKKLKINLDTNKVLSGSVECFKHCKQLNDIDIYYSQLRKDFFANIASFVPKLQFLRINTKKQYSDSFINHFHPMKNIQRVILTFYNKEIRRRSQKDWYFGKSLIEVMLSPNGMNVKHITHNCGLTTI